MAASNFRQSLSLVLAHEGGFVNNPNDPGGATCQGITQKVYDAYCQYLKLGTKNVRNILDSEVSDIYYKQYWKPIKADSLPCGLDYAIFDFAVNSGIVRAAKYLQIACGFTGTDVDGIIGLVTVNATDKLFNENAAKLIAQYCANRLAFLQGLTTYKYFGNGWSKRVAEVVQYAIAMAHEKTVAIMPEETTAPGKAMASTDDGHTYVQAPAITGNTLADINDQLAAIILASGA